MQLWDGYDKNRNKTTRYNVNDGGRLYGFPLFIYATPQRAKIRLYSLLCVSGYNYRVEAANGSQWQKFNGRTTATQPNRSRNARHGSKFPRFLAFDRLGGISHGANP
jgi:hypothetical protein